MRRTRVLLMCGHASEVVYRETSAFAAGIPGVVVKCDVCGSLESPRSLVKRAVS